MMISCANVSSGNPYYDPEKGDEYFAASEAIKHILFLQGINTEF